MKKASTPITSHGELSKHRFCIIQSYSFLAYMSFREKKIYSYEFFILFPYS